LVIVCINKVVGEAVEEVVGKVHGQDDDDSEDVEENTIEPAEVADGEPSDESGGEADIDGVSSDGSAGVAIADHGSSDGSTGAAIADRGSSDGSGNETDTDGGSLDGFADETDSEDDESLEPMSESQLRERCAEGESVIQRLRSDLRDLTAANVRLTEQLQLEKELSLFQVYSD
jgi:hypothetical protein